MRTGERYSQHIRLRRASDDAWRWHLAQAEPVRGPGGDIMRWLGSVTDVHDLVAAQEALRASEARLRDLMETVNLGVFLTRDRDGTIRFWSEGCARLYGWTAEDAVGRVSHDLLRTQFPVPLSKIEAA